VDLSALRERYLAAQLAGNRREVLRLVVEEGLQRGATVGQLQAQVIRAAQAEIGRLWQHNRISIAQEHLATALSQLAMAHLFQHAEGAPPNGRKVVVACVEGELHDFPARLVSDALELAGFEVRFLGANVPTAHLVGLLREEKPDLLCLSATMSFHTPALRAAVLGAREASPGLPVLVGGQACSWAAGLAEELGVERSCTEAHELVERAERLTGLAPRAPQQGPAGPVGVAS
jgi:methanogenic corrinoid protein MtbC1